jgi:hypothetical protein
VSTIDKILLSRGRDRPLIFRVDLGTVGKIIFHFLFMAYDVGLAISTRVGAIVEIEALKHVFSTGDLFVANFVGDGSMRSGCPCACG